MMLRKNIDKARTLITQLQKFIKEDKAALRKTLSELSDEELLLYGQKLGMI